MILKNPSWRSINPGLPSFHAMETVKANEFLSTINMRGIVYHVYFDGQASNFYRLDEILTQRQYFVKYIQEAKWEVYDKTEQLALWLQQQSIPVNVSCLKQKSYFFYQFLKGERLKSEKSSLVLLGAQLATLHQSLERYPETFLIKQNTEARISRLMALRKDLVLQKHAFSPFPEFVAKLAASPALDFSEGSHIRVLHGDLHPGNLMLINEQIVFFDFEDCLHSYLPVIYELAFVLERMVFTRHDDSERLIELGSNFLRSYLDNGGEYRYKVGDESAFESLALRSFCVLTLCELEGIKVHEEEWYKFYNLAKLAKQTKNIFKKILQGI